MRVACADGARAYVPCPQLAWRAARIAVGFGKLNAWMLAKPTSSSHRTSPPTKTITAGREKRTLRAQHAARPPPDPRADPRLAGLPAVQPTPPPPRPWFGP